MDLVIAKAAAVKEMVELQYVAGVFLNMERHFMDDSFRPFLELVVKGLEQTHKAGFDAEKSPSGVPWPKWYFRTSRAPLNHKTLNVSGALERSVVGQGHGHVQIVTHQTLTWGTDLPYAWLHQTGQTIKLGISLIGKKGERIGPGTILHLPKREFVGMSEETVDQIVDAAADTAIEFLKTVGYGPK